MIKPLIRQGAGDGIGSILPFLFHKHRGLIVVLGAYFDESYTKVGPEPITVAGYVFKPSIYERHFKKKWARLLLAGPKPTDHFHMTELYAGKGKKNQYDKWTVEQRAEILSLAVDAVRKHTYGGIVVRFSQSEFEAAAPPDWPASRGSIYTVACQMALRVTMTWLEDRKNTNNVAYFFESGQEFWEETDNILKGIGSRPDLSHLYRYHTHAPLPKKDAFGLQAADMLAWIMTRLKAGVPDNHTMRAFKPIITELVRGHNDRYRIYDPDAAALRNFFAEQPDLRDPRFLLPVPNPMAGRFR